MTPFIGLLWKQLLNIILLTHALLLTSLAPCYHGHQGPVSLALTQRSSLQKFFIIQQINLSVL